MAGFQITRKDDVEPFAEYFDRRITIQAPGTAVPDGQGGNTTPYVAIANSPRWAHMEPMVLSRGAQRFEGQQLFGHGLVRMLIRYKKTVNINDTMRVVYKSKILLIRWVGVPGEARKVIELFCEELQAEGSVA